MGAAGRPDAVDEAGRVEGVDGVDEEGVLFLAKFDGFGEGDDVPEGVRDGQLDWLVAAEFDCCEREAAADWDDEAAGFASNRDNTECGADAGASNWMLEEGD